MLIHSLVARFSLCPFVVGASLLLDGGAIASPGISRAASHDVPPDCCVQGGASRATHLVARTASNDDERAVEERAETATPPPGMVWIPGGEFSMGSTDPLARRDESPVHRVRVDGFWMDETAVTNAQFRRFVDDTGYLTVAERPIDWEELRKQLPADTPKPPEENLLPGSLVFFFTEEPVDLGSNAQWWRWVTGANWRHPEGPDSSIDERQDHPVVHVAYEDALAYAAWAGKRLPTEAEWEFAARGGLDGKVNVWGDEPVDATRANIWQGTFPHENTSEDGFVRTSPVKSFPANGYGLYDMAGNVWEWCVDLFRPDTYAQRVREHGPDAVIVNPKGPARSFDPRHPHEPVLRVQRSGSFLCNDSYCASYRPSARMPGAPDTGASHVGFRCVKDAKPADAPSTPATE